MLLNRLSHWAVTMLAAAGLALFAAASPAAAQYDEEVQEEIREGDFEDLEYEPGEGLHEEEWYDPSDWFDVSPGISYENDGYYGDSYWYDDDYYSDDYYDYDEYGYDDDYFYDRRSWYDEDYYTNDWWDGRDFYEWYD